MRNSLEQFVKQNRDAFDSEEPSKYVEEKIIKQKTISSLRKSLSLWTSVAAIFILLVIGSFYLIHEKQKGLTKIDDHIQSEEIVKELDPVKAKEVEHFTSVIEKKQVELEQIKKEHPQLYEQFAKTHRELDSIYHQLESELATTPNQEVLLEAMIQNLWLQTGLLSRQLEIVQKLKQKNQQNERKTI